MINRRIDLGEHVALLDVLALGEIHRHQLAIDLRAHRDSVQRADRADTFQIDRHVLHARRCRQHRHRQIGPRVAIAAAGLLLPGEPADVAEAAEDQQCDQQRYAPPQHGTHHAPACGLRGFVQLRLKEH